MRARVLIPEGVAREDESEEPDPYTAMRPTLYGLPFLRTDARTPQFSVYFPIHQVFGNGILARTRLKPTGFTATRYFGSRSTTCRGCRFVISITAGGS